MNVHIDKAKILIKQSRYKLAQEEIIKELNLNYRNPIAHSLMALCLSEQNKYKEALSYANCAISIEPNLAYSYYVLACILLKKNKLAQAEKTINIAISLNSNESSFFLLLATIYFQKRIWQKALEYAQKSHELDSENITCENIIAMSLMKMGKREESENFLKTLLKKDPEDSLTHANKGWINLELGKHDNALEHFKESLRLDPELEWAKEGFLKSLKSKYLLYRIFLKYSFFLSKFSMKNQWLIILISYIAYMMLKMLSDTDSNISIFIPFIILYIAFAVLIWIVEPLFTLILSFDNSVRLLLSPEQIFSSNLAGCCIVTSFISLFTWTLTGNLSLLLTFVISWFMIIPLFSTFCLKPTNKIKSISILYTIILAILGIVAIIDSSFNSVSITLFFTILFLYFFIRNTVKIY